VIIIILENFYFLPEIFNNIANNLDVILDFVLFLFIPSLLALYFLYKLIFKRFRKTLYFVYIDSFYEKLIFSESKKYNYSKRKWITHITTSYLISYIYQQPDVFKNTKYWSYIQRIIKNNPDFVSSYKECAEALYKTHYKNDILNGQ